jgi:hypothetical protein
MWITLHDTFTDHPKVESLADTLGVSPNEAIGIIARCWSLAMRFGDIKGSIGELTPASIARRVQWEGDPLVLIDALLSVRLLDRRKDERLQVHNWDIYTEQWQRMEVKRKSERARKRAKRVRGMSAECPRDTDGNVRGTSAELGGNVRADRTGSDRTGSDRTEQKNTGSDLGVSATEPETHAETLEPRAADASAYSFSHSNEVGKEILTEDDIARERAAYERGEAPAYTPSPKPLGAPQPAAEPVALATIPVVTQARDEALASVPVAKLRRPDGLAVSEHHVAHVIEAYVKRFPRRAQHAATIPAQDYIRRRLAEGYTPQQLEAAAHGASLDPWAVGKGFTSLKHIFGKPENVDRFVQYSEQGGPQECQTEKERCRAATKRSIEQDLKDSTPEEVAAMMGPDAPF